MQLYLHDAVASIVRPLKELKGFQKVKLAAGESKVLTFTVDTDMLSFYNRQLHWGFEPGRFDLMLGSASDDIRLQLPLELLAR